VTWNVRGLLLALLVIVTVAVELTATVGWNVTISWHVAPAATGSTQVLSDTVVGALVSPLTATLLMISGSIPLFLTVSVVVVVLLIGCRPKAMLVSAAIVGGVAAVPVRVAAKLLPVELTTVSVAALDPDVVPVGLNRTVMLHDTPAARALPVTQVLAGLVIVNCVGLAPPRTTGLVVTAAAPVFFTTIV
jgi:hypothetical protein